MIGMSGEKIVNVETFEKIRNWQINGKSDWNIYD